MDLKLNTVRQSLIQFSQYIDPQAAPWYAAKHLSIIANALERIERGELKRLLISVPPRHWKSSLTSEKFPAWYLGKHPTHSLIIVSHTDTLATKFSSTVRATVESNNRYRLVYPNSKIDAASNRVDDWMMEGGYRSSCRAVGSNGNITGWGAKGIILDDTIANEAQAASDLQREKLYEWYRQRIRTRLEPEGWIVGVNTRYHEDDLFGRLIAAQDERGADRWEVINIPAWDGDSYLWLERYTVEEYEAWHHSVGEFGWATQFMGNPVRPEGGDIKRAYFQFVSTLPDDLQEQARTYDLAITLKSTQKSDPDYTASVGGAWRAPFLYLIKPKLFRAEIPELVDEIASYKMLHPNVRVGLAHSHMETSVVQMLNREGIPMERYDEHGDPLSRTSAFIDMARQGKIVLVGTEEEWSQFMEQWTAFPRGRHDDAVACTNGLLQMFNMSFQNISILRRRANPLMWSFADA